MQNYEGGSWKYFTESFHERRNIFVSYGKFVIFENISRVSSFRNEEAEFNVKVFVCVCCFRSCWYDAPAFSHVHTKLKVFIYVFAAEWRIRKGSKKIVRIFSFPDTYPLTFKEEAIEKARGWIGGIRSNKYSKGMLALADGKSWRINRQTLHTFRQTLSLFIIIKYRNDSIWRPGAYLLQLPKGRRFLGTGRLFFSEKQQNVSNKASTFIWKGSRNWKRDLSSLDPSWLKRKPSIRRKF